MVTMQRLGEFRSLGASVLSGESFLEEDFDRYMELGAELIEEAELSSTELGKKKKKKGIFGKITGLFKKSLFLMDPLIGGILNKKKGKKKKKKFLFFGIEGADELGDLAAMESIDDDLAAMATRDPNTATVMASLVTSAAALTDAGLVLPPKMQATVEASRQALTNVPGADLKIAAAEGTLTSVGIEVKKPTNWLLWAGIGVGAAAVVGVVAYSLKR